MAAKRLSKISGLHLAGEVEHSLDGDPGAPGELFGYLDFVFPLLERQQEVLQ